MLICVAAQYETGGYFSRATHLPYRLYVVPSHVHYAIITSIYPVYLNIIILGGPKKSHPNLGLHNFLVAYLTNAKLGGVVNGTIPGVRGNFCYSTSKTVFVTTKTFGWENFQFYFSLADILYLNAVTI